MHEKQGELETQTDHIPVMVEEVLSALGPKDGGVYVDGTFGGGGYSRAILEAADCTLYAIDRDPEAIKRAKDMAREYPKRLIPIKGCFGDLMTLLRERGVEHIDGLVLDLGVSSFQIDTPDRGFSFLREGPLDMRMDMDGPTAADIVNTCSQEHLADIIYEFGEERDARKIARHITAARESGPILTTVELAEIIHQVKPRKPTDKIDPATKTFQALRIYINDELGELDRVLRAAERLLNPRGRLVVVTFHSLEDWRVKNFLRDRAGGRKGISRHLPETAESLINQAPLFELPRPKFLTPSPEEIRRNARARSAKLRHAIRTNIPAKTEGEA